MKKLIFDNLKLLFAGLFFAIIIFIIYIKLALPDVGDAPEITIKITKERVKRGKYLANAVSVCMDCHSTRDWSLYSGPLVPGTLGKGGEVFNQAFGFPGEFYSKNITPYGIGKWTDGEVFRAITSGVNKNEEALFPVMPHPNYGKMDKEDIYSIIAYLRTLEPIESAVPASSPDFPMNIILNTIPKKATFSTLPKKADPELYGEYLFNAAACAECHTKAEKGEKIPGMELAGGFEFKMPFGIVRSPNITPDSETGIGNWSEAVFIKHFKSYADSSYIPKKVEPGAFNTVMPWMMYAQMEEEDLSALYAYLRTVKPIKNEVTRFTPDKPY